MDVHPPKYSKIGFDTSPYLFNVLYSRIFWPPPNKDCDDYTAILPIYLPCVGSLSLRSTNWFHVHHCVHILCVGVGVVVDDVDVVVVMKTSDCLSHGYGSKLGTQKWRAPRHMFTANHWFNPSQSIILLMNVIRPYQNHNFHLTSFD